MINKSISRTTLAMLHDMVAAIVAWMLAYQLRFNFELPPEYVDEMRQTVVWVAVLQLAVFWALGLYKGIWRYASLHDLRRIVIAVSLAAVLIPFVLWMLRTQLVVPRTVLIFNPVLLLLLMGGSRLSYRFWKETRGKSALKLSSEPVLVLGAGDAAVSLSKDLAKNPAWQLVGFLDDDKSKQNYVLNGVRVLGQLDSLQHWVDYYSIEKVIIAMPASSHQQRQRVIALAQQAKVTALTVPSFDDLMSGKVGVSELRAIELDDLLGRDPVKLDKEGLHEFLAEQVVMVTGAGGSIGSELCRQIANFQPSKLVLFEQSEFALYTLGQELERSYPELNFVCIVGDVKDGARVAEVLQQYRPSSVFHAAAYKHVPMMEQNNAWQAIRNNVLGTWTVAQAAQQHGVRKFVLISTDKAVNPTNVMGASKRLAELVCQALQNGGDTRFVMVRFGNVLGSTGSVIPKFRAQIAQGGPITVTHPEITR
ncbi:MAG: nucleoside-diphosphate sugar epimerase/dehydratase, partial [Gallionella sp.]